MTFRRGDDEATVAGAEVVDDVGRSDLDQLQHLVDDRPRRSVERPAVVRRRRLRLPRGRAGRRVRSARRRSRVVRGGASRRSLERLERIRFGRALPRRGASPCPLRTRGSCREEHHLRVALEGEDVGRDAVEEPAVVRDHEHVPANSSSASSSARSVSTSRSFDGSSEQQHVAAGDASWRGAAGRARRPRGCRRASAGPAPLKLKRPT